jgi:transcriptional regulator with XRE-family HTH domain
MREQLGRELRETRSTNGLSLEATSRAARISQAYLHKLEAGVVDSPSPRVLQRLSGVLGVSYRRLMELADYLMPDEAPAKPSKRSREKEVGVPVETEIANEPAPTNQQLARLLNAVLRELGDLRRGQDELTHAIEGITSPRS